ncbi:MAG TPA: DUF4242 domain-containing protein [Longimicrobiales bacterium]|nr:DUF4242 domain-containing protein [Longimicrobiales bacterium]
MPVYVADRDLPGITMDQLAGAQKAAIETSKRFTEEGRPVRYIRSMYVPGDDRCMCLFDASDADTVRAVNDEAEIPYTRVVEAHDLTPS